MLQILADIARNQTGNLPVLVLHAAAIVGLLSLVLTLNQQDSQPLRSHRLLAGLTLGLTGNLMVVLQNQVSVAVDVPLRASLGTDILFLGGLFGGGWGGLVCLVSVAGARALFGGIPYAGLADMAALYLGGVLLHHWLLRRNLAQLGLREVISAWLIKTACSLGSPALLGWLGLAMGPQLVHQRLFFAPLSLLILASLLALLRRVARERELAAHQLKQALTDPLTRLPNRNALRIYLDKLLQRTPEVPNTLLTLEVFNLNDLVRRHGHDWTDNFWRQLVIAMRHEAWMVPLARYRPRYFMFNDLTLTLVLHGVSLESAQQTGLAEALHADLNNYLSAHTEDELVPQLHMAVAMGNNSAGDAAPILRDLNLALHSDGRPVRYFNQSFAARSALEEQMRLMLIDWIRRGQAPLRYQPKCHLSTGEIEGAEALLRAVDAQGRPVSPPQLLEVAAQNQLLIEFEWCTVLTVVHAIGQGLRAGRQLRLAVNVSAASIAVPGFGKRVVALLRATGTPCELLAVEVTESSPVPDIDTVSENIAVLSNAGVRLALDDFGTGYSALSLLAKFPFNEVKIDHSMVARLDQPRMQAAISLAYESAHRYNATLVAEGVETQQQIDQLGALGIRCGQGYFFAHAMELDALLQSGPLTVPAPLSARTSAEAELLLKT